MSFHPSISSNVPSQTASKPASAPQSQEPFPSSYAEVESSTRTDLPVGTSKNADEWFYPTKLNRVEKIWRDRFSFLLDRGLLLRPRYQPDWKASWIGTGKDPGYCEDAIEQILPMVLDATRIKDGVVVCLKMVENMPKETNVARFLSSEKLLQDPRNHTVPVFDVFRDPISLDIEFLVMPVLRPFDDPDFGAIGEVVDFVTQILEGLVFMHDHLVAHGDCTSANIMMDGRPIYPGGWHFVLENFSPDGVHTLKPLARIDHPVRYFFVDFGLSRRFKPGESYIVDDAGGRDSDVPELSRFGPWDIFKIDVFTVGNMFSNDFHQKYLGLEFLTELIDYMRISDPKERPTAQMAQDKWNRIKGALNVSIARWRLQKRDESISERVVLDTLAVARQGLRSITRLFHDDAGNSHLVNIFPHNKSRRIHFAILPIVRLPHVLDMLWNAPSISRHGDIPASYRGR